MKEYLKCPVCGQTQRFKIDSVMTVTWDTQEGLVTDARVPQIFQDSYIRCNQEDCEMEGEIQEFWVGDKDYMREPQGHDDLFLDDIHEGHKDGG